MVRFGLKRFRKHDGQDRLIGPVHDLDAPASPVLALLIAFRNHVTGLGECRLARSLEVRIGLALRVFHKAAPGLDIEVIERRSRSALWRKWGLAGRVA